MNLALNPRTRHYSLNATNSGSLAINYWNGSPGHVNVDLIAAIVPVQHVALARRPSAAVICCICRGELA